jgi:hypothetical protein
LLTITRVTAGFTRLARASATANKVNSTEVSSAPVRAVNARTASHIADERNLTCQ